jgi:tRNA uridine 5-carboxymethylaminomethyl modification enzyme
LRQDNADSRLSKIGYDIGLLPERNYRKFEAKQQAVDQELHRLRETRCGSETLAQLLRRPEVHYHHLPNPNAFLPQDVIQRVEIEIKYAGYIDRQQAEVEKLRNLEDKKIPDSFNYSAVPSLRTEARQKLMKIRPATLGQALRISGVSPADIGILTVWLKRCAKESAASDLGAVREKHEEGSASLDEE